MQESFPFSPTNDQSLALQQLNKFLNSSRVLEVFLLKGYAGTGKTSILAHVAQHVVKHRNVVLLAPTGRAAKVLSNYCNLPAFTIHKQIYKMVEDGFGAAQFVLNPNKYVNTLFIVDEASMVSSGSFAGRDLLEDLMRYVYRGKGCKLILSGDTAQLPPVEMAFSPALNQTFLSDSFHLPIHEVELSNVVRQELDSGILENATLLRNRLLDNSYSFKLETNLFDFVSINGLELQEKLEESISEYGMEEVLIITRSNKRANQFNNEIRNRLLFRDQELEAGDYLMGVKNNYHWLGESGQKGDFLANGESLEVLKVLNQQEMYGFKFADVVARFPNHKFPDLDLKIWLDSLQEEGASLPQTQVDQLYHAVLNDYYAQGEKKTARMKTKADPFFNALQVKFSYAVTCHKSQGGQWSAVFIDHGYLTEEMVDEGLLRWMYTAITRATTKVYLVNFNEMFLR